MQKYKEGCFYCEHNQTQKERMIEIVKLPVTTVYLNRDQTHFGRVIVALNWHVTELFELDQIELHAFIQEVADVAETIKILTNCEKINYAIYGDTVAHLHFHLVPKIPTDVDWDDGFINTPSEVHLVEAVGDYKRFGQAVKERLKQKYETVSD